MSKKQDVKHLSLKEWINEVSVPKVAKLLCVTQGAVRHWRSGLVLPTDRTLLKIEEISKGTVSFLDATKFFLSAANARNRWKPKTQARKAR